MPVRRPQFLASSIGSVQTVVRIRVQARRSDLASCEGKRASGSERATRTERDLPKRLVTGGESRE